MNHFEMMKMLIQRTAPSVAFSFSYNTIPSETGIKFYMLVTTDSFTFSVLDDSIWTDVRRVMMKKLADDHEGEWVCEICCEVSSTCVNCNKCSNDICGECYIRTFIEGQGMITCPFCRQKTGQYFQPQEIDNMVHNIRQNLSTRVQ